MLRALPLRTAAAVLVLSGAALAAAPVPGPPLDLQFSLCETPARVESALALAPRGAPFEVWLFDDPALALFAQGLRIRLRGGMAGAELTLKVAEQDCARLPPLPAGQGKCEYDLHGDKVGGSLSLTHKVGTQAATDLASGRLPLAEALGAAQTTFLRELPGAWPLPAGLRPLGPIRVRSYRAKDRPYVVDISELPGGQRFIEISRKVALADATRARADFEADLAKSGVPVCADQTAQAVNKLRALLGRR